LRFEVAILTAVSIKDVTLCSSVDRCLYLEAVCIFSIPDGGSMFLQKVATCPPDVATCPPGVATCPPDVATCPPGVATCPPDVATCPPGVATCPPDVATCPTNVAM
jgi:hypothetical protein